MVSEIYLRSVVRVGDGTVITRLTPPRRQVRVATAVALVVTLVPTADAYVSSAYADGSAGDETRSKSVAPRPGITVATTDAFGGGRLVAFAPNGSVLHYEDR